VDPYVRAYKIGSGDITWPEIIEHICSKRKTILIATGASELSDVKRAVSVIEKFHKTFVLMQCNTNYTAKTENFKYINLNVINTYRDLFPNAILGLSDHTLGHATVLGAIALGAKAVEKHFTDDNGREGPDHKFAMNPVAWREMINRSRELELAMGDGEKRIEGNEKETAFLQRRGLRYAKPLSKGHVITASDMVALRPFTEDGFAPFEVSSIVGKTLTRDVGADDAVLQSDVSRSSSKAG
jgi:N-acetylneuraminate synthase